MKPFILLSSLVAFKVLCAVPVAAQVQATPGQIQTAATSVTSLFSAEERARVVAYWNAAGRYTVGARTNADTEGPFVVRLTPAASIWFRAYNQVLLPGKLPPTMTAAPTNERTEKWETWVKAKLARDRWQAQRVVDAANAQLKGAKAPAATTPEPPVAGVMPAELLSAVGNPPPFAMAATPLRHVVTFDDVELSYHDHIAVSNPRYGYYRFDEGVMSMGLALRSWPDKELSDLFAQAGFTPFEQHVVKAVSKLEGGFDSVNTYDTGFVSVGFIQFATLSEGAGSLGDVLRYQKRNRRTDFERDFRVFGIDVDNQSTLVVVDPATGAEVRGPDANRAIINDKRLIAVFQRAGQKSTAFRLAQIEVTKQRYYPADHSVTFKVGGREITARVSDVIKSEAGMATLLDRSVNTGNIRLLGEELGKLMTERNLATLQQVAPYERELIKRLKWRHDFLQDTSLSQPR
ncbi:MAG: hypothetical protein JWN98_1388 [Abditibacteriota bacterium]|nr:hypothetical protein [Abditibacteriota bacterium]